MLCLLLEVVSSAHAWPQSACLLRETGLLHQLLRIHAGEMALKTTVSFTATATAREVLVGLALRDVDAATRVCEEIKAKVEKKDDKLT